MAISICGWVSGGCGGWRRWPVAVVSCLLASVFSADSESALSSPVFELPFINDTYHPGKWVQKWFHHNHRKTFNINKTTQFSFFFLEKFKKPPKEPRNKCHDLKKRSLRETFPPQIKDFLKSRINTKDYSWGVMEFHRPRREHFKSCCTPGCVKSCKKSRKQNLWGSEGN